MHPSSRVGFSANVYPQPPRKTAPPPTQEIVGKLSFDFATTSPAILQALAAGNVIDRVAVLIQVPFDDPAATLRVGTSADLGLVFSQTDVDLTVAGTYDDSELFPFTIADLLLLTLNPAGSTRGSGLLIYKMRS